MSDILEKIPPQNLDAEMAVLGSMLIDDNAIPVAVEALTSNSFYKDSHRKIFEAIINLYNNNRPVDMITVSDELKRMGLLEQVGGAGALTDLVNCVPTAANISHYAGIVKEKSVLRSLITNATQIVGLSYESDGNVDELLDRAERLIFNVSVRLVR
jgi:replicative DNA helicase